MSESPSKEGADAAPLHDAAYLGKTDEVARLVNEGADVNARDSQERTPLHMAAWGGDTSSMKLLISKGANLEAKAADGRTPLHLAAWNESDEPVKLLIEFHADVNAKDAMDRTPLFDAAWKGSAAAAQTLIAHGANVEVKDELGHAPEHMAIGEGHSEIMKMILAARRNNQLSKAVEKGDVAKARKLLKEGADVNACGQGSMLHKMTPLHFAAGQGDVTIAQLLLDHGAKLEATDWQGATPLHAAARNGHETMIRLLAERGADIHARDRNGFGARYWAKWGGHVEAGRTLSALRQDKAKSKTHEGAQHDGGWSSAGSTKRHDWVPSLRAHKLDRKASLDPKLNLNRSLIRAVCNGNAVEVGRLIDNGADVNVRGAGGCTPLHWAVRYCYPEVTEVLLKHGADRNIKADDGLTASDRANVVSCPHPSEQKDSESLHQKKEEIRQLLNESRVQERGR